MSATPLATAAVILRCKMWAVNEQMEQRHQKITKYSIGVKMYNFRSQKDKYSF